MVRVGGKQWWRTGVVVGACSLSAVLGCNPAPPVAGPGTTQKGPGQAADEHDHDHDHDHDAPHGGALVVVGEETAHVEFVLDQETGELTAYVYDAHVQEPVAIAQTELKIAVTIEKEGDELPEAQEVVLVAVEPKDGQANQFAARIDALKGAKHFDAALQAVKIGDQEFKGITFSFPEGNEAHDHDH